MQARSFPVGNRQKIVGLRQGFQSGLKHCLLAAQGSGAQRLVNHRVDRCEHIFHAMRQLTNQKVLQPLRLFSFADVSCDLRGADDVSILVINRRDPQ